MSSYPPGGDYDERLLDSIPKASKAEKQEGYNVNLLASDASDSPMNARPTTTVDGHTRPEAGTPTNANKEAYVSSYSVPWYRQKKWRILMLIGGILAIGAIVGGAVGGTLASKNNNKSDDSHGSGPSTVSVSSTVGFTASVGGNTPLTTTTGTSPPASESSGGAIIASPGPGQGNTGQPAPTPPVSDNLADGVVNSDPMVAPVVWAGQS